MVQSNDEIVAIETLVDYVLSTPNVPHNVLEAVNTLRKSKTQKSSESVPLSSSSCILTKEILTSRTWYFSNSNGYLRTLQLLPDGTIASTPIARNETTWKLETEPDKPPNLQFFHSTGEMTSMYPFSTTDHTGRWQLQGPYIPKQGAWTHYLSEL